MSDHKAGQNIWNDCFQALRQQAEQNWDSCEIKWGKSSNCSPPCRKEGESKWAQQSGRPQQTETGVQAAEHQGFCKTEQSEGGMQRKPFRNLYRFLLKAKSTLSDATPCACSVTESHPILWESMNSSLPGSTVHGVFLARIQEQFAISISRGSSPPKDWTRVSCIIGRFFTTEPRKKRKWH